MALARIPHRRPIRSGKRSTLSEKTAEKINGGFSRAFGGQIVLKLVGAAGILFGILTFVFWLNTVYADPKHVFWSAVENNLSTQSITKEIQQNANETSSDILTQIIFSPEPRLRSIKETTTNTASGTARITVESIGTPTDTYQHYTKIEQPGNTKDYSSIYPMWIKGGTGQANSSQIFNNAIFSAMLFGNIPASSRDAIVQTLHETYKVNFDTAKKGKKDGRKYYTYETKISLRNYAKAANIYAKSMGLPNADQINPNSYQESSQLDVSIVVDVLSRQVKEISYKSSKVTEKYSGYGIHADPKIPTKTVDYNTLQKSVQELSK